VDVETFGVYSRAGDDLGSGARGNSIAAQAVSGSFSKGVSFSPVLNWNGTIATYRSDILRKGGFAEWRDLLDCECAQATRSVKDNL
jgi:hypothetical protein